MKFYQCIKNNKYYITNGCAIMEIADILKNQSWPIAIAMIILGIMFRGPISHLIYHTRKIEKLGLETGPVSQEKSIAGPDQVSENLKKALDDQLRLEQEQTIRTALVSISNVDEREQILIRYLAAAQLSLSYEEVYRLIYGSQIEALQNANAMGMLGISKDELKSIYNEALEEYPEFYNHISFEIWIGFILRASLMKEDEKYHFHITVFGRGFLHFLVQQGRSLDKPF